MLVFSIKDKQEFNLKGSCPLYVVFDTNFQITSSKPGL